MAAEPENLVLELLRDIRTEIGRVDVKVDAVRAELKSDINSLRADVAADLLTTRKELSEQIVGLRRTVVEYHSAVIGHGIIISDLEARPRRVEQHLNLPPVEAH